MAERRRPIDVASVDNPVIQQAFTYFCRHLVALVCRCDPLTPEGAPDGSPQCFAFSGQILSVRGAWSLLTAGHILRGIEARLNSRRWRLQFFLADDFGPGVINHHAIPFDYHSAARAYIDENGLDFGVVCLRPYYRALLEKNAVVPITEENWARQSEVKYDRHFMIGFPTELRQSSVWQGGRGYEVGLHFCPAMVYVHKLASAPEDCEPAPYERFVGRIGQGGLDDLDGMSGCPIYGLSKGRADRYWIVAIQNSWLPQRRIVFGTPIPLLGRLIEDALLGPAQAS
jgi:hypothetical protein